MLPQVNNIRTQTELSLHEIWKHIKNPYSKHTIIYKNEITQSQYLFSPKFEKWFPDEDGFIFPLISYIENEYIIKKYKSSIDIALSVINDYPNCEYLPQTLIYEINAEYPEIFKIIQYYSPITKYKNVLETKKKLTTGEFPTFSSAKEYLNKDAPKKDPLRKMTPFEVDAAREVPFLI